MSIRPPSLNIAACTTKVSMLQRSKSAGKQPARQQGYLPLPSQTPEVASSSGSKVSRQLSPGPEMQKRQAAIKRTIAPGQVSALI
jgi:hypothetical protein